MCGIWSLIGECSQEDIQKGFEDFMKIKHRGPMFSNFQVYDNVLLGFHRLSIMDTSFQSNQPYVSKNLVFVCNGEIYNYKELNLKYNLKITGKSDCLSLFHLYKEYDFTTFLSLIAEVQGEFAFILLEFDEETNKLQTVVAGRDPVGIRPLYYGKNNHKEGSHQHPQLIFSSEIKACSFFGGKLSEFPPGHVVRFDFRHKPMERTSHEFTTLYKMKPTSTWSLTSDIEREKVFLEDIREAVMKSVRRRLVSDQPIAFLLSGGVDSSLVAALSAKIIRKEFITDRRIHEIKIKTFCCGLLGEGGQRGSDLEYAKKVAYYIDSDHTEVLFTAQQALDAIDDVIYTTETWDVTTIRASVGQYLVSKYIAEHTDAKVLFVGEGPDEVCSSYLFNWYAPDPKKIHPTAEEYVKKIHYYDVKRADRCIARWGLEARVALLDPEFIESYWRVPSEWRDPKYKGIEKYWLRKAFEADHDLPLEVLWRKKEAFSDGISSLEKSWFEIIQEHIQNTYGVSEKEYYRNKFIALFGERRLGIIPGYWQPKWDKDGNETNEYVDPSARTLDIYHALSK